MAEESVVVRVAREYREQLARNEDEALRRMARSWAKMETQLFDSFKSVSQEIEELQKQGVAIPKQLIYNQKRYQQMLAQVQKNLTEYDDTAIQTIKTYQRKNYNLGLDSANATLKATSPSSAVWNEVSRDTAEVMVGFAGNGAPLAELMKRDYGSLAEEITDALVTGIGLGKGAYATAKDMRDAMGMEYNRSVRIARTETNRAYRIANAEQYAKSGVVEKVLRLCYPPTACFACLMMDGEECPNGICDDHPNGKCTTIAVTIGGHYPEWQKGSEWLEQQDEATQRAIMGDARYEMWKKDGVPLRDMVTMKDNPVWGGSPSILSINDIKQRYNVGNAPLISIPTPAPQKITDPNIDPQTGRPKNEPDFLKPFNYAGRPDMPSEIRKIVNPNYSSGKREYTDNCQRCVVADELQWRGYDVEAKPYNAKDPIKNSGWASWEKFNWRNDKYGFKAFETVKDLGDKLESAFTEWGDDARAILRVQWKAKYGGNGHFVTVRKDSGAVLIEDPQIGRIRTLDELSPLLSRSKYSHWLMRVDNRPLSENVKYAVKNRGEE